MQLNDQHVELLKKVRAQMAHDMEIGLTSHRPYLCWNIAFVDMGVERIPTHTIFEDFVEKGASEDAKDLLDAVGFAIGTHVTFAMWLDAVADEKRLRIDYLNAYSNGRIAWLDKMIETRVIA